MRPLAPSLLTASALSIVGLQNAALPKAHPPSEGRSKATLLSSTAVAQISTPSTGAVLPVNSSITFQGGNQGGSIPDYCRWDFGDGAVLQSSTQVSHTYAAPGTYVVKLTTYTENRFNVFIPSATASISLTILAPPVIQAFSSSPSPINLGQSTTLTWSASGATALSLSGIGAVAGTSRVVTPPPPPGGTGAVYSVPYTLTASNAVGSASATASVRVNRPPAFSAPSYGATLRQKNSAALALNPAGDPDGDTLTYALSGALPPGLTLDLGDPAHPTLKGTPSVPGTYALTLTAKDPGGFTCSAPWSIQVLPPLPTLSFRATPAAILQGQSSTLAWSATEATTLTLSGVGTVTGSSLVVTPSATTTYTLTATGLGGSTAASLTLSVDHPPAFSTSLAPQTLTAKRAFSLQLPGATDPDGDALSYSVGGLPPGLSFDPATLNLSGAPTSPGTWTLTETASDGRGGSCQQSAPFTVLPGDQAFTYDPNGNLLSDGTRSFEWDAENRLVAVVAGTHRSEFLYDGLGRRVGMVEKENGATVGQREYLWDGREPIQELSTDTGTSLRDFYPQGYEEGATALYYTRDHLGSIREVTDAQGQLRARYDYDPYGRMTKVAGDKDSPFGYTGHLWHAQSGLNLTLFRAYDPDLGRWVSRDPIGENAGTNLFSYVNGNPIKYQDLLGLDASVTVNGNNVTITIPIHYEIYNSTYPREMTSEITQAWNQSMESAWSGKIGKYNVQTKVVDGFDNIITYDESGDGFSRSNCRGGNRGQWYAAMSNWAAAHEAGHLMGLPDQYADLNGRSIPNPGYENNIMGNTNGVPSESDITNIINANLPWYIRWFR